MAVFTLLSNQINATATPSLKLTSPCRGFENKIQIEMLLIVEVWTNKNYLFLIYKVIIKLSFLDSFLYLLMTKIITFLKKTYYILARSLLDPS